MRNSNVPLTISEGYIAEFVWKSTSYDRMQNALKTFAVDDTSVSGVLQWKIIEAINHILTIRSIYITVCWVMTWSRRTSRRHCLRDYQCQGFLT